MLQAFIKRRSRQTFRKFSDLIAVLAILAASGAEAADKIVLFQNLAPISAITLVAKQKGIFAANGLDVDVRNVTSGKLALDALIGGSATLATVAEVPIMRAALTGEPVSIIATIEKSDDDVQLLARKDLNVATIKDLQNKKVATAVGTSAEYLLVKAFEKAGVAASSVSVINLRPQDMAAALSRGDIAAYAIWEPHIHTGTKLVEGNALVLDTKNTYVETFNIAGMKSYVAAHPDEMKRFITALIAAETFIAQNPDESINIVAAATTMDVPTLRAVWPKLSFKVGLDPSLISLMKSQAEWDSKTGKPAAVKDVNKALDEAVDPTVLKSIAPKTVTGF